MLSPEAMLSHPQGPKVLAAALHDLMAWLHGEGISGAVIGGVAALEFGHFQRDSGTTE